ncbi:hypothetical protein OIU74_029641, partial [Salix koriyanagi]
MALRKFYNEIKGLKVKEFPNHVKPMLSLNYVKKSVQRGMDNYHAKYIETSLVDPVYHGGIVFIGVLIEDCWVLLVRMLKLKRVELGMVCRK